MDKYEAQRLGTNADAQSVLKNEVSEFFPQLEAEQEISEEIIGQFYDWQFPFTYTQDGGGARRWRASVRAVCRRNKKLQQLEELFESSGTDGTLKEVYSGQDEDEYTDNHATRTKTEFAGVGTTTSENLGDTTTNEPVDGKNTTTTVRKKGTTRTYADGRTWTQILKDVGAAVDPVDEFINAFAQVLLPPCEEPCCPLPPSVSMAVEIEELPIGTPPTAEITNRGSALAADWLLSLGLPRGWQGGVDVGAVRFDETQDLSDPQKQKAQENIGINPTLEQLEDGTYNLIIGVTGDAPNNAAITQINGEDLAGKEFYEYVRTEGAVLFSFNPDFSPAARYGGSWENITDRFLIGAGGSYALGSTGGEANVTLTVEQMPSHSHIRDIENNILTPNPPATGTGAWSPCSLNLGNITNDNHRVETRNTGGGRAHNNIPPYLAANIWRRVA